MTREEALNIFNHADGDDKGMEAIKVAIKSLKAWDEVIAEINECLRTLREIESFSLRIESPLMMEGRKMTYEQCLEFINKHLGEADDRVTDESIIRTHLEDVVESGFSLDEIANVLEKMRNAK